jgi:predicted dehydrogenase
MIGVGVIGYGYWGPNLVRNFADLAGAAVIAVSDCSPQRLAQAKRRYPSIEAYDDYRGLLANSAVDVVAIATPVSTHFELAMAALEAGRHTLVEKPIASNSEQALRLIDEAERRNRILMVDHTFVYTGAVRKIEELIASGQLGDVYYYDSVRVNLGLFQHDVNVLWDLAVHDLSILDYVLPLRARAVSATGMSHVPGKPENIAYLTLFFDGCLIAHLHVNWLAPVKVRRTLVGGSRKMIVYDDVEPSEKIKVYDKGVTVDENGEGMYQMLIGYRTGDMWAPKVDLTEALRTECAHFIDCVGRNQLPLTDGECGFRVVRILEAATQSMALRGQVVELEMGGPAA